MFIINLQDILTLSESSDIEMIQMYQSFVRQSSKGSESKLSRQMGYISSVNDAKDILEKDSITKITMDPIFSTSTKVSLLDFENLSSITINVILST